MMILDISQVSRVSDQDTALSDGGIRDVDLHTRPRHGNPDGGAGAAHKPSDHSREEEYR